MRSLAQQEVLNSQADVFCDTLNSRHILRLLDGSNRVFVLASQQHGGAIKLTEHQGDVHAVVSELDIHILDDIGIRIVHTLCDDNTCIKLLRP